LAQTNVHGADYVEGRLAPPQATNDIVVNVLVT
jgi:hypothetical protein